MEEREGYLEPDGLRTWYRVVGDPDGRHAPLLCLHGGPGSTHNYFAPLERLAGERAVVVYDQVGCGRSQRRDDIEWGVELFLRELAALRAHLGLERIHLLGTSWGGMLALEHALSGAGGVVSLILSSTLASSAEWAAEAKRLRDELPPEVVAELDRYDREQAWDDPGYERALEPFDGRHFYRGETRPPELERMLAERDRKAYRAMWGPNEWTMTGALRDWDVRPRLHEIDVPTLVIRGRYDLCTDAIAATLVNGIRGAREVVLEESSHTPVLEETDRYLDIVSEFIRAAETADA